MSISPRLRLNGSSLLALAVLLAGPAWSFPWMVKHNYGSCAACHVDPSGAGQLTLYGRAQADLLVQWRATPREDDDEVPQTANFLWFLKLPEWLNLSGNTRLGPYVKQSPSLAVAPLLMAAELYGTVDLGRFVVHGSGGVGKGPPHTVGPIIVAPACDPSTNANYDAATGQCRVSFVSREHWLGVRLADEAVMIRAGRMFVPFGLRNNEHFSFVRALTKTDLNVGQQVGVSASFNSEAVRGEVMALLGNYQLGPDAYRERGYSLFAEYAFGPNLYVGAASLIARSQADPLLRLPLTRHAHGLFVRFAPVEALALLAEADLVAWQQPGQRDRVGFAAMAQADWEPHRGVHLLLTLEAAHTGGAERGPPLGVWTSVAWYALPHLEVRVDGIVRRRPAQAGAAASLESSLLLQLHTFL